jgi:hypothetical protein
MEVHDVTVAVVATSLVILLIVLGVRAGRDVDLNRAVLLHAPVEVAWEHIRFFPSLLATHGRVHAAGSIQDYALQKGDGETVGSIWRARGRWRGSPYWADVAIDQIEPCREIAVRLVQDSLGTHRGLTFHRGILRLEPNGPDSSKLSWRLEARLRGIHLLFARLRSFERLQARLLDLGLRSIKIAIDRVARDALAVAALEDGVPLAAPPSFPLTTAGRSTIRPRRAPAAFKQSPERSQ